MRSGLRFVGVYPALFAGMIVAVGGCGQARDGAVSVADKAAKKQVHDHSGWWCDEHGVPEAVCAQCNAKLAAEFKKKGDWCEEHDRPKSQCFKCDPKLREKFATQYRAKYGTEPPPIEDDEKKG